MQTNTETQTQTATLADFISFFHDDQPVLNQISADIESAIADEAPRELTASGIIEMCLLDPKIRIQKAKEIKDKELLNEFFRYNKCVEHHRAKIETYPTIQIGFKKVFANHTEEKTLEELFSGLRQNFKKSVKAGELTRQAYLGKKAGCKKDLKTIINTLTLLPFGCEVAFDVIYDLCQHYYGSGIYGEPILLSDLETRSSERKEPVINYRDQESSEKMLLNQHMSNF
jgi:hypothetical protein